METGLLNFHDEEHFPVFCEESSELVNDNSIFDSFVDLGDEASAWILPDSDIGFGLSSVITETKEDYQKTIQDWQQHISNLQVRENDVRDDSSLLSVDPFSDIPDIFGADIAIPQINTEVPKKKEVSKYKVAKREGLVLKLTKKKDNKDCDKSSVNKPRKDESVKQKKKDSFSAPIKVEISSPPLSSLPVQQIKSEPYDDYELPTAELDQAVANIGFIQSDDFTEFQSYDFGDGQPMEYSEFQQPVVNDIELEQAVANIEPLLDDQEWQPVVEKVKKEKSSKSKKRHSCKNKIIDNPLPQIKIEADDYFSVKSEFVAVENNDALLNIKVEPNTSPFRNFESPIIPNYDNYFGTEAFTDEHIDVEHVDSEPAPILEAGDMTSLLKQFESSNPVYQSASTTVSISSKNDKNVLKNKLSQPESKPISPVSTLKPTTKSILEALPKEVIDRIKESSKRNKKSVPVVPAERLPRKGCENMKDAGATPTKAERINLSNQRRSGETVKLDHDYCTNQSQQQQQEEDKPAKRAVVIVKEEPVGGEWEKKWDSRKDSGLESGDMSDSSETLERGREKQLPPIPSSESIKEENHVSPEPGEIIEEEPKKKKLNLEEYRNRRKNVTPKSPIKCRANGWSIPSTTSAIKDNEANKSQKVNAEVQVKIEDGKTDSTNENRVGRSYRNSPPQERLRRRSSSSSSSSLGKSRYHRRGRSKRRRHSKRTHWSRSRSRSRSRSHSRSRTRSRSRSSSDSYSSSSSRSRSRSRGRSRRRHRSRSSYRRSSSHRYSSRSRSARITVKRSDDWSPVEKMRQVEERRVIYVGRLEEGTTRAQLRERFTMFGPIIDISLHFREKGDNYGFVTFTYKADAYEAVEHGNDYPYQPKYDICFGGRRAFCKQRYSDLENSTPPSVDLEGLNETNQSPLPIFNHPVDESGNIFIPSISESDVELEELPHQHSAGISNYVQQIAQTLNPQRVTLITVTALNDSMSSNKFDDPIQDQININQNKNSEVPFPKMDQGITLEYLMNSYGTSPQSYSPHQQNSSRSCDSFDRLLREAQKKLKRSNHV